MIAPGGQPIGTQQGGARPDIRTLPGGRRAAEALLQRLTNGRGAVDITPPRYSGRMFRLDDGTVIGFRPTSTSGSPAIDINIPGYATITKLHF
jgi:hypothetical protein